MDTRCEADSQNTQNPATDELIAFWQQLRHLRASGPEGLRWSQRIKVIKQQQDFCLEFLDKLAQKAALAEADAASTLIVRVHVHFELAHLEEFLDNIPAAKEILLLALTEAQQTKDEQTIYSALMRLGQFSLNTEQYDEAVVYFQRSIRYAPTHYPYNLTDSLYFLGEAWSYRPETLPLAVAMFDWVCQLDPSPINVLLDKYKCLVSLGETERVKEDAAKKSFDSCIEAASTAAARFALGRRKRAGIAAMEGLRLAEEQENRQWQSSFEFLLEKCQR